MAAPNMPRRLWTLDTLEPGMGLIVRLNGVQAVERTRERADADPVVELGAGYNLVAWMGDDHTALNQASGGIGPPLRGARVWSTDGDTTIPVVGLDLQREALSLPVAHGTALWVNVDRATYGLQSVLPQTHIHWFTHLEINTDCNKRWSATIQYGGGSFHQLIARLSVEGCEAVSVKTDGLEFDLRHTNDQKAPFRARFSDGIDPGTRFRVGCVDNCEVTFVSHSASEQIKDWLSTVDRCRPMTYE